MRLFMKVLWFAVTPSLYSDNNTDHNGGGWISSLEALIKNVPDIELGIAFEHTDTCFRVDRDSITYYPINVLQSKWQRLKSKFIYKTEESLLIPACLKIIDDFKPDIIQVFGSEWCFGLLAQHINIPVVIHIQGSIPSHYNARFPSGYSTTDLILYSGINIIKTFKQLFYFRNFKLRAFREEKILRNCQYYLGRTEWDKNLTQFYNPISKYFYCSEALREPFINPIKTWQPHNHKRAIFITIISPVLFKGVDLILKTAKLLKENANIDFEWRMFGVKEIRFHEWKTKIKASDVNVNAMGVISAEYIVNEIVNSDIFIHPSYLDNSPNSVCEAQILGVPVISTNVGGICSLVKHYETGLLTPANDPHMVASYVIQLLNDQNLSKSISDKARDKALKRHEPKRIISDLLSSYKKILDYEKPYLS